MSDNPLQKLEEMDIGQLRKLAKIANVPLDKTDDKETIVHKLNRNRGGRAQARMVFDENDPIPAGYVRIKIWKGQDGSEGPVPVAINRFQARLPRDIPLDVPREVLEVLNNSVDIQTRTTQDKEGRDTTTTVKVRAYSFEVLGQGEIVKGGVIRPLADPQRYGLRTQFRDLFGRWPRGEEERKFREAMMASAAKKAGMFDDDTINALSDVVKD